jgi:NAD(P)-dependent dehydrogenase (short-subunit alcohol dehydrogenase family)
MTQLDIFSLKGKVALIAGGGGAIGSALAEALAGAGAQIAVSGHTSTANEAAVARVVAAGSEGLAITADATSEADSVRAVEETIARFGSIDIVINAVGGGAGKVLNPAESYPRADWDWIMELNVRSTVIATQPAVRSMIERGRGGAVLNLTSVRANLGINAGYSAYVAAKGAISSLTRQWATEWAKHGIRVNAIMPTFVDTPQDATLLGDPAFKAGIVNRIPIGRVGETRDLVGPAIFLVSDASSFVTGQVLGIDGGLTATQ